MNIDLHMCKKLLFPVFQHTIAQVVEFSGIGLHSGHNVSMRLLPAEVDTGIIFRRTDLGNSYEVPVSATLIGETILSSTLVSGDVRISTIEHLLSACSGLNIDNLYIELDGPEVPVGDGSAKVFVECIQRVGAVKQIARRRYIKICRPIYVMSRNGWVSLAPYPGLLYNLTVVFNELSCQQTYTYHVGRWTYMEHIAPARTFAFIKDISYLLANGLARGAALDNVLILHKDEMINRYGFRFHDEIVRHKILDVIGDLQQLGYPIIGEFNGFCSSHFLNNQLTRKLLTQPDCWRFVYLDDTMNS